MLTTSSHIPAVNFTNSESATKYADFTNGQILTNYTSPVDTIQAFETYLTWCENFEDQLVPGSWDIPAASDTPEELPIN